LDNFRIESEGVSGDSTSEATQNPERYHFDERATRVIPLATVVRPKEKDMAHLLLGILVFALVAGGAGVALHSVGVLAPSSGAPFGEACGHEHNETGDHNETGEQNETADHDATADLNETAGHSGTAEHNETAGHENNETDEHGDNAICDREDGDANTHHETGDNDANDTKEEAWV